MVGAMAIYLKPDEDSTAQGFGNLLQRLEIE